MPDTANPLFDALEAAQRLVDRECDCNAHLIEDPIVNELVEFAANGRHTDTFDLLVGGPTEARARVLPADPDTSARYTHEPAAPSSKRDCDRCGVRFGPSTDRNAPEAADNGFEGRDGTRHTLWMPAGSAAVEIVLCRVCRDLLEADFSPVAWR